MHKRDGRCGWQSFLRRCDARQRHCRQIGQVPVAHCLDGRWRRPTTLQTHSWWLEVVPIVSAPDELSIQAWIRCPWYGRFPQVESASLSRISMKQLQRSRYRYGQHRGSTCSGQVISDRRIGSPSRRSHCGSERLYALIGRSPVLKPNLLARCQTPPCVGGDKQ
jgi:hypothetical protein